ncbi:uncharacterized protein TNCV_1905571 [Trichonephila clavipes]|nr:uncharacterized protein TNCV_1905571 [Trichonephila clavipes]
MWFKILLPNQHYPLAAMVGKDGKIYFRLVDVEALLGLSNAYKFTKRFDTFVIQGKDVLPVHKPYPVMTQKSKLVTPDVMFNNPDGSPNLHFKPLGKKPMPNKSGEIPPKHYFAFDQPSSPYIG